MSLSTIAAIGLTLALAMATPLHASGRTDSWLMQIEASLAATAAQRQVDSPERQARVNNAIRNFRSGPIEQPSSASVSFSLPPATFSGGGAAHESQVQQFELTEQVRMKRQSLIQRSPGRAGRASTKHRGSPR